MLFKHQFFHSELVKHWLVTGAFLLLLILSLIVCFLWPEAIQYKVAEETRVLTRSILYLVAILLFPFVKLLRYILIRLNQTMPIDHRTAKQRYLTTVIICLTVIELVGGFGVLMFVLGDGDNTLFIFGLLAVLGIFLHKPNYQEYQSVCVALDVET